MTARIVVALVAAGAGTLAGLAIARKVVAAQAVEAPRNRTPRPSAAKRPISAREELGSEGLDAYLVTKFVSEA